MKAKYATRLTKLRDRRPNFEITEFQLIFDFPFSEKFLPNFIMFLYGSHPSLFYKICKLCIIALYTFIPRYFKIVES